MYQYHSLCERINRTHGGLSGTISIIQEIFQNTVFIYNNRVTATKDKSSPGYPLSTH